MNYQTQGFVTQTPSVFGDRRHTSPIIEGILYQSGPQDRYVQQSSRKSKSKDKARNNVARDADAASILSQASSTMSLLKAKVSRKKKSKA